MQVFNCTLKVDDETVLFKSVMPFFVCLVFGDKAGFVLVDFDDRYIDKHHLNIAVFERMKS